MTMKVKTRFTADEDISRTARRIDENVRRMNRNIKRGFEKSTKSALNFRTATKSILTASIVQKGFGMLKQGVANVAMQFGDFDKTTREAATRFIDIGAKAANFNEKLKELRTSARLAGESSLFTAPEAAKVLDIFARAGFDSATAMKSLKNQIDFAVATGEDFVFSTTVATKLLGAFSLAGGNAAEKSKNLGRVNDVLAKLVNSSNVNLENVFDTMKLVGKVAKSLGSDLEEVSAFTAVLGDSALDGSVAMTALRNLFLRSAAPTKESTQLLKALGLSFDDGTGKAKNMTRFLTELRDRLGDMGEVPKAAILEQLFGKQAITGVLTLMEEIPNIKKFKQSFKEAGGEVAAASQKIGEALPNKMKTLISAMTEFSFKAIKPLENDVKNLIDSLTILFRELDPGPLVKSTRILIDLYKRFYGVVSDIEAVKQSIETFEAFDGAVRSIYGWFEKLAGFKFDLISEKINVLDTALKPITVFLEAAERGLKNIKALFTLFRRGPEAEKMLTTKTGETLAEVAKKRGLGGVIASVVGSDEERERRERSQRLAALSPAVNVQPNLNVNVENKITAKNVEIATTVTAPGTFGVAGANAW